LMAPVDCEPDVAIVPLVPVPLQPPDGVQLVALVDVQVKVEALPAATCVGLAEMLTVTGGGGGGVGP